MQFSFSYYYYVLNRDKVRKGASSSSSVDNTNSSANSGFEAGLREDLERYLQTYIDTNNDGVLGEGELSPLVHIFQNRVGDVGDEQIHGFLLLLSDCLGGDGHGRHRYVKQGEGRVQGGLGHAHTSFSLSLYPSVQDILQCANISRTLHTNLPSMSPSHVSLSDKDLVAFEMLTDNLTVSLATLQGVRSRSVKFICLNDNMLDPPAVLLYTLRNFYESLFPHASVFELPRGQANPTLYLDEYKRFRAAGMGWGAGLGVWDVSGWLRGLVGALQAWVRERVFWVYVKLGDGGGQILDGQEAGEQYAQRLQQQVADSLPPVASPPRHPGHLPVSPDNMHFQQGARAPVQASSGASVHLPLFCGVVGL
eukprot:gene46551-57003_t